MHPSLAPVEKLFSIAGKVYHPAQQKMICYMRCVNAFFIDITNIFVNMTDFLCDFNQKDTLRIPNECLCVILTYYFLLCERCRLTDKMFETLMFIKCN